MMKKILSVFASLGEYVGMTLETMGTCLRHPPALRLIRDQMYEIGVLSLPVVAITGLSTGAVLAVQAFFQLADKGLAGTTGLMVTKSLLAELGPILTAFMITGRVGAAMAAELGTMKVTEQVDALSSMAINPISYLVSPRFIAMIIMVPLLTIFSAAMGILGAFLIACDLYGMSPQTFFYPIPYYCSWFDCASGLAKAFVFGLLIVTISCWRGLKTEGGAHGVGRATTSSVVTCYSAILLANFILTVALHASYWSFFKS
jgi:phospholipid/cholesterol/gamma-HCH transport system permease protein